MYAQEAEALANEYHTKRFEDQYSDIFEAIMKAAADGLYKVDIDSPILSVNDVMYLINKLTDQYQYSVEFTPRDIDGNDVCSSVIHIHGRMMLLKNKPLIVRNAAHLNK